MMRQLLPLSFSIAVAFTSTCYAFTLIPFASHLRVGSQRAHNSGILFGTESDNDVVDTNLPKDEKIWKSEGERIILEAATKCGAKEDDVDIQWKSGRVVITVSGASYMETKEDDEDEEDVEIEYDDDIDIKAVREFEQEFNANAGNGDNESEEEKPTFGSDVVSIARAINYALGEEGEGSIAYNIAVHHEIEVTTPGASDELHGIMFESYKGFNVIVEALDKKKNKVQMIEGKLVERNDEKTILNVKGRMRKFKNELVESVRLPKAKREKGVR